MTIAERAFSWNTSGQAKFRPYTTSTPTPSLHLLLLGPKLKWVEWAFNGHNLREWVQIQEAVLTTCVSLGNLFKVP